MVTSKAPTVAAFLEGLPPDGRKVLAAVRKAIRAAAPGAAESMDWGMPTYKEGGWYCAFNLQKQYFALYINDHAVVTKHTKGRPGLDAGKSCIRFTKAESMPPALVAKLVKESHAATVHAKK